MELRKNMLFDGRYRLLSFIGSGASAQVWRASDTQANNLVVALKIFCESPEMNTYGWQNFEHEFTSVYNLIHTNLLPPTGYNRSKDGDIPYLILQYCDNGSATSMVGRIDEPTLIQFLHDVSAGLAYLHERNIIHQDIKPDNILLDEQCNFLVTDFGISTVGNQQTSSSGSRAYMGPERFPDPSDPSDAGAVIKASDIWSLGATAYELVTGDVPYGDYGGAIQKSGEKCKPLPDTLQPEVRDIIERCLNLNPWDRPKAKDIQLAIERYWADGNWKGKKINPYRKYYYGAAVLALLVGVFFIVDYNRTKVRYYSDYAEVWGIPQGVGRIGSATKSHVHRMYRFEYKKGKLRRMSHVNSYGKLIEDSESERAERPVDMRLFYTGNGKLNKVKVYSRGGKVQYVRSYNDKLNNITFRYDDEYETEKRLGAQTIGYVHALLDEEPKGQISHYLLSYDRQGRVDTLRYANSANHRCCDQDGIYGRAYVHDKKGRVVEEKYLGYDGAPKATSWGLGKKLFSYDGDNNLVRVQYQTVDGHPARDARDGIYIYEMVYDRYGNAVEMLHKDADGNLMIPQMMNYSVARQTFDNRGNIIRIETLDPDRQLMMTPSGYAVSVRGYDKNGYLNYISYRDVDDRRCTSSNNYSIARIVNDDFGNQLEFWFYDSDSTLVVTSEGSAGYKCQFDSVGNVIEYVTFGPDQQPMASQIGSYGWRMKYNDRGMRSELTYLGPSLQPATTDEKISVVRYIYDEHANEISRFFYDSVGRHLVVSIENISGWNSKYDEYGNETERTYFDADSNRCMCTNGFSRFRNEYNERGNCIKRRFYDHNDRLVMVNGKAGENNTYDERGNLLENCEIGLDEHLAPGRLKARYRYDKNDNVIEFSLFNRSDNPATNSSNYHRYTVSYDNRNNPIETRYYNTSGRLTRYGSDTYSIQRDVFDNQGFRVETRFYGIDERPVICKEGWFMSRREYDPMGNVVRQLFFDLDERPTDPKRMVPEGNCKYDSQGHMVYISSGDGYGHIIDNPRTGWAICEYKFDRRGNNTEVAYFDEYHQPTVIKGDSYCKVVKVYDEHNNQTEIQYHNLKECYEKEVTKYNEKGRKVEWRRCYGNGTLKPYGNGVARYTISYESNGVTPTMMRVYDIQGNMLFYARYNARTQQWGDFQV